MTAFPKFITMTIRFNLFTYYSGPQRPDPRVIRKEAIHCWQTGKWLQNSFKQLTEKSPWIPHFFNDVAEVYFISPQQIVCLHFNSILKQQERDSEGCINKATD